MERISLTSASARSRWAWVTKKFVDMPAANSGR
jgi:hypothetical protein